MLKKIKDDYFSKSIQFILTDFEGIVIESDNTLLKVDIGDCLENIHPFFTCIESVEESKDKAVVFNCVQLGSTAMKFITDIEIINKEDFLFIMIHDLTQHYTSYQLMAQARNESIINAELVVLKNAELEIREKFKNQFIRNFSHELRNPLTSIVSIINIIQATELTNQQRKMIEFLKASNANLKLMLEDILSLSMIAAGKLQLSSKVFNLTELLELIKFTYSAKAKEQELEFNLFTANKVPDFVEGDRLRLYQVLANLIENAFKFTDKGKVSLAVTFNQKWANKTSLGFKVSDTGRGIPSEKIESIFESFSKLDANGQSGSGLGLSIVKGILNLMGGKIKVESTIGEGSNFYFDLVLKEPLHTLVAPEFKNLSKRKRQQIAQKSKKEYRLLLVEDDEHVQMMLFKILVGQRCFKIDFASDGAKVMEQVVNATYDIILMDVELPNVNGDTITKLIRNFPFNNIKKIPIVGITANAYPEDIATYMKAGMSAVISKPFEKDQLLATIFKYL